MTSHPPPSSHEDDAGPEQASRPPAEPPNYVRPSVGGTERGRRPAGSGFLIGVMMTVVTLAAMGGMWSYAGRGATTAVWVVGGLAVVGAAVLEVRYRRRGVIAGVAITIAMAVLVGVVGFWVVCGSFFK